MKNFKFINIEKDAYSRNLTLCKLCTTVFVVSVFFGSWWWSVLVYNLLVETESDSISLIAPVPIAEFIPKTEEQKRFSLRPKNIDKQEIIISRDRVASIDKSLESIPQKIDITTQNVKAVPQGAIGKIVDIDNFSSSGNLKGVENGSLNGIDTGITSNAKPIEELSPPIMLIPTPIPVKTPAPVIKQSTGATMGRLISIINPVMPAGAKALGLRKQYVLVEVNISAEGLVTSIRSVSGHPTLITVAKQSAMTAKFRPTLLSGEPIKTIGIITFNFN